MLVSKRCIALLFLWVVLFCGSTYRASAQNFRLQMRSDPGDWIGLGQNYDFNSLTGTFSAEAYRYGSSTEANYIQISYYEPGYAHWFYVTIGTNQLEHPLRTGFYKNVQRAPFAAAGHPGLDVSGDGRGSNTLTGAFRILEAEIDNTGASPRVIRFAASFIQHSEGNAPALRGLIQYNSSASPPPDSTAPITTLSRSGNVITLNAYGPDIAEDVASTSYQIDGGDLRNYSEPFFVYGPAGSTHTVTYWSEDFAGNRETPRTTTFTLMDTGLSTSFQIWSSPGDYIGQGRTFTVNRNLGIFSTSTSQNTSGDPNAIAMYYFEQRSNGGFGTWWNLTLKAPGENGMLAPGYFGNATRYPFQEQYSPGLDFSGDGRGSNVLSGAYWIHELEYDLTGETPRLLKLAASFAQHSEGVNPPLFGIARYNSTASIPDALPPYTMAQLLYTNFSGWYRPNLTFPLKAGSFLNRSTIAATYYQLNDEPVQRYSNSALRFDRDGVFTLRFWSVDADGRVESPANTMPVRIDGTPPELSLKAKILNFTNNTVTLLITGRANDKLSGINQGYLSGEVVQVGGYRNYFNTLLEEDGTFSAQVTLSYIPVGTNPIRFLISASVADRADNSKTTKTVVTLPSRTPPQ